MTALPSARAASPSDLSPSGSSQSGIANASGWRTDSPTFGKRPIYQFVFIQGEKYHSGQTWMRAGWGTATIRTTHAEDSFQGYRRADIERIARDNDMDIATVDVVGWLPASPPAPTTETLLPRLQPCDDGEFAAQPKEINP